MPSIAQRLPLLSFVLWLSITSSCLFVAKFVSSFCVAISLPLPPLDAATNNTNGYIKCRPHIKRILLPRFA